MEKMIYLDNAATTKTFTGLICRILGFFYRIYLSRTIGAEGLGLYQMVHPLFGICFALCAGSLQTALSQYVAARQSQGKKALMAALSVSLSLSVLLAWLITSFRTPLARYVLLEPRCAPFLPVIALSVPFRATGLLPLRGAAELPWNL